MTIPVTLTILSGSGTVQLSQTAMVFTAVAGVAAPPAQSFGVLNRGSANVSWTASARTYSGSANWLLVSPGSGIVTAPLGVSQVQVLVDSTGLPAGSYQGQVAVTPAGSSVVQILSVLLNVLPAGSTPPPLVRPTGLIFTAPVGTLPGSQQISISNPGSQTISYISGRVPEPPDSWFVNLPNKASIAPGQSATITVQPSLAASQPGLTRGSITLLFDDGSLQTLTVLLVASTDPGLGFGAGDAGKGRFAGSCTPAQRFGVFTSVRQWPVGECRPAPEYRRANCGRLRQCCDGRSGSVGFEGGESPLSLNSLGDGTWEATWTPFQSANGRMSLTLSAADAELARASVQVNQDEWRNRSRSFPEGES